MDAEEFMRAALRAGAQVEYVDGRLVVTASLPPGEYTADDGNPVQKPRSEPANRGYIAMKEALAMIGVTSHISHISASLAVLYGARHGEWMPGTSSLKRFMSEIDVSILAQCCVRAVNLKHTIRVRGKRISLSTAALGAAMYAAMDQDANLTVDSMEPIIAGTALERKSKELASEVDKYGGQRTIEYRRVSYKEFLSILIRKEV